MPRVIRGGSSLSEQVGLAASPLIPWGVAVHPLTVLLAAKFKARHNGQFAQGTLTQDVYSTHHCENRRGLWWGACQWTIQMWGRMWDGDSGQRSGRGWTGECERARMWLGTAEEDEATFRDAYHKWFGIQSAEELKRAIEQVMLYTRLRQSEDLQSLYWFLVRRSLDNRIRKSKLERQFGSSRSVWVICSPYRVIPERDWDIDEFSGTRPLKMSGKKGYVLVSVDIVVGCAVLPIADACNAL
ncbi:hypothetical protein CALCODRAFT_513587, partial [Calocera cornea HHB12733]